MYNTKNNNNRDDDLNSHSTVLASVHYTQSTVEITSIRLTE